MTNKLLTDLAREANNINPLVMSNLFGAGKSLVVSSICDSEKSILVICESNSVAGLAKEELEFFSHGQGYELIFIPDAETLPYDQESPHPSLVSLRAKAFNRLLTSTNKKIVLTSVSNMIQRISSVDYWKSGYLDFSVGDIFNYQSIFDRLIGFGYTLVKGDVSSLGEFSLKNSVFDIYPFGHMGPYRIRVDSSSRVSTINEFSIVTQRSGVSTDCFRALVTKELPVDSDSVTNFKKSFRREFGRVIGHPIYEAVSSGELPSGIEYFLPLFQNQTSTLFDILLDSNDFSLVCFGDIEKSLSVNLNKIERRFNDIKGDEKRKVLPPSMLWIDRDEFNLRASSFSRISLFTDFVPETIDAKIVGNGVERQKNIPETANCIEGLIETSKKVVFCYHSNVREEQIQTILNLLQIEFYGASSWQDALSAESAVVIVRAPIEVGFRVVLDSTVVVSERDLFGQPIYAKNEGNFDEGIDYAGIQDLKNIEIGDPVVHISYGVGKFDGLKTMQIHGVNREYMSLSFAENASYYVPMDDLDYVSRYGGMSTENVTLDVMGSEKWIKGLSQAVTDIETTSHALLRIQAEKLAKKGTSFRKPGYEYHRFCKEFPFQETRDQSQAISDIIKDMTSITPMDRTVVGDVGFGKTEVAMRAAFIAALSGYQVAVVVPTSLLAQQHFENFTTRFSSFSSIKVGYLTKSKDEKETLRRMRDGTVHIVISTHRLLQDDVVFSNLGLLVIDEEHRFGVYQKELLRAKRTNLDVLSMTATPIPRTLSMSMSGIRDLSVIATPPAKRLSIRTIVCKDEDSIVNESIQRELLRDGQVFILHNVVETIHGVAEYVKNLIPGIRVGVCHGQMKEKDIETTMGSFYKKEFDVLVCTTIIETGIDVPNANTILIMNSENFGIAQLHQLRGRVGRSHHQAYAYLLTSKPILGDNAFKRLKAMEKATSLGEGFVLANHDLEIRGSGELLGEEQSGHIKNIGFALYMRLLNRAIEIIRAGGSNVGVTDITDNIKFDLNISGLIDCNYIENDFDRLSYYKRFASSSSVEIIDAIVSEMQDKYGDVPQYTVDLINLNKLKCEFRRIGIKKIVVNNDGGYIDLEERTLIDTDKFINLAERPGNALVGPRSLNFQLSTTQEDRIDKVSLLINSLL